MIARGGTTNNYYLSDGGSTGGGDQGTQVCTPGAKDCVTSTLARICAPDGSGYYALQCAAGDTCSMGDCKFDPNNTSCTPGQTACASNNSVAVCNNAGTAFTIMNCPGTTLCGNGTCFGACTVGESKCDSSGTVVLTCSDGTTFTPSPCPANNFCVSATMASPPMAFCIPATVCQPDPKGCDTVCGDKTNAANDPTKYTSTCVPTATGYQWQVTQCPSTQSCDPAGGASCGGFFNPMTQAGCRGVCSPGQVRCGPDGVSTETCDATGNWGAPVACDTATGQSCFFVGNNAVCGDLICSYKAKGVCVMDMGVSKFRPCVNGKLGDAMACAKGLCGPDLSVSMVPPSVGQPGTCLVQCQMGDVKCANNATQGCTANGTWSTMTTPCAAPATCRNSSTPAGRPAAVCGVCDPGTHRCTDAGGTVAATGPDIEACGANGQWGAPTACAAGYTCESAGFDNACTQECKPGTKLCMGASLTVGGNAIAGTAQQATCPASGLIADATPANCPSGQSCRADAAGNSLGCVVCVGGQNENGLVDTRCANASGLASGTAAVQTCKSDSSGWDTAGLMMCTAMCQNAAPKSGLYACGDCPGFPGIFCSNSNLAANFGNSCAGAFGVSSGPCGATPDCCSNSCTPTANPAPATCK